MRLLGRIVLATFFVLVSTLTLASAENDPPGRVARLQYMTGSVSVQPRGTDDWVAADLNRPLTNSDNIWTDKDSRTELNLGGGILRLDSESSLTLTNVSDNAVQLQLHQGTLSLRIRKLYGGEIYEVDTPNMAFTVQKSGDYRFDVGPNDDVTLVTVWKGEGDATGDGPAVHVRAHQRVRFTDGTSLRSEIYGAPSADGFDDWCQVRNRREDHSYSARYVSPGVIGYEDLDDYGSWRVVPDYGTVWVPTSVVTGWAPYRYGHWIWISPWGWTWVDDAPWGFAPFHYGRWVYYGGYWGWAPGPAYVRPVYAPALVAWFGGSGWGVGLGFAGGYGWCPLGYGEPFIPWYRGSSGYFRSVNVTNTRITNITYITNNYYNHDGRRPVQPLQYANLKAPGAMTAVHERTLTGSLPVARNAIAVSANDAGEFSRTPLRDRVAVEPTRESRLGNQEGKAAVVPPVRTFSRPVMAKMNAPAGDKPAARSAREPVRVAEETAVTPIAKPVRSVPQPPQRAAATTSREGMPAHNVPRPPAAGAPETRAAMPAAAPRPPATASGSPVTQSAPHQQRSPVFDRQPENDSPRQVHTLPAQAPRPASPPEAPRGVGPDVNRPRTMPDSTPRASVQQSAPPPRSEPAPRTSAPSSAPAPRSAPPSNPAPAAHGAQPPSSSGQPPRYR